MSAGAGVVRRQEITRVTTEAEELEVRREVKNRRHAFVAAAVAFPILLLLGGFYIKTTFVSSAGNKAQIEELSAASAEKSKFTPVYDASFAEGRRLLALEGWEKMIPHVRHPERAGAMMRWFYGSREHQPLQLETYQHASMVERNGVPYVQMRGYNAEGAGFWLHVAQVDEGPKLDWEWLGGFTRDAWTTFLHEDPDAPRRLRVRVMRTSLADRYFLDRRLESSSAYGLKVWASSRNLSRNAVVPRDSPIGKKFGDMLNFQNGMEVVVDMKIDEKSKANGADEPMVSFVNFVQEGWVLPEDGNAADWIPGIPLPESPKN